MKSHAFVPRFISADAIVCNRDKSINQYFEMVSAAAFRAGQIIVVLHDISLLIVLGCMSHATLAFAENGGQSVKGAPGATRSHAQRSEHGEDCEDAGAAFTLDAALGAEPPAF